MPEVEEIFDDVVQLRGLRQAVLLLKAVNDVKETFVVDRVLNSNGNRAGRSLRKGNPTHSLNICII